MSPTHQQQDKFVMYAKRCSQTRQIMRGLPNYAQDRQLHYAQNYARA